MVIEKHFNSDTLNGMTAAHHSINAYENYSFIII